MLVPAFELELTVEARLGAPIQIGPTYECQRHIIPILDGHFVEPDLRGTIVPLGGADWQYTRHDGVTQVEATYALRTDDDVVIQMENFGLRHGPAAVMRRLAAGETADPAEYYFRANPRFKAPEGKYEWLNRHIFVASGARYHTTVKLWFFLVK